MFKVIIDATPIAVKPSGVGLYVANLIEHLRQLQRSSQFELGVFYQPSLKNWLHRNHAFPDLLTTYCEVSKTEMQRKFFFPYPVRVTNLLINNFPQVFPFLLDKPLAKYQVFHGTNFTVFPEHSTSKVMTIYDLTFLKYPQYIDRVVAKYYQRVQQCLRWTDLVIAISESTKQDIVRYLNVNPQKVYVTPLASRYTNSYLQQFDLVQLRKQIDYNFDYPYLLFVGTIEPRKNLVTLIEAFNYLKKQYKIEHNLILIGKKGWKYKAIFEAIAESDYRKNIYHLDYLNDELVALCYKLATVFVYPSYYEGFGLPLLEAIKLGTPVVCSNTSSLPEVVGDAALQINPHCYLELAEAIIQVIKNDLLRKNLIAKGNRQAKNFSWQQTAYETLQVYRRLLNYQT